MNECIKSLKFSFKESNIQYEEYFFHGIPIPYDIKINNVDLTTLNISWNIIETKNPLKYKIEMAEDNKNFIKIYEGNEKQFFLVDLYPASSYELEFAQYLIIKLVIGQIIKIKTMIEWTDSKN